jgi:hypothetical protein
MDAPKPPASKAKKILRRTLSGARLLAIVTGLLWWNSVDGGGRPLYWATGIILIAACSRSRAWARWP